MVKSVCSVHVIVGLWATALDILRRLPATLQGHVVSKGLRTAQGVEHKEEPPLAITQFYQASIKHLTISSWCSHQ